MYELTKKEQQYVETLTAKQRQAYTDIESLKQAPNSYYFSRFIEIASLYNAFQDMHQLYNDVYEADIETEIERYERFFSMTMGINGCAAAVSLLNMDDCDLFYMLLAGLKMHAFDELLDNVNIETLLL